MRKKSIHMTDVKTWKFFRAGGFDQVSLESGADLLSLDTLDQKLWVALACPVKGVHFDNKTLELIDTDCDGRVRVPELLNAIQWTRSLLNSNDELINNTNGLALKSINSTTDEGALLVETIRKALIDRTVSDETHITVEDIEQIKKNLSDHPYNGDGIITEDTLSDTSERSLLNEIMRCCGSKTDQSGKEGISKEIVERFFSEIDTYAQWYTTLETVYSSVKNTIKIDDAVASVATLKSGIDDYFLNCQISSFTGEASGFFDVIRTVPQQGSVQSSGTRRSLESLPLAFAGANRPLPLQTGINPFWKDLIEKCIHSIIVPLFGQIESLSEQQWEKVLDTIGPSIAARETKPVTTVEQLGISRIRELTISEHKKKFLEYIALDMKEAKHLTAVLSLEKLVRYTRDLYPLCTNFVNFSHFYTNTENPTAMFIAGNLFIDQRNCHLCIRVDDIAKHSLMAAMAGTYLAYCECQRTNGKEKMFIVAAITNGDSDNLIVGRNGIFYDRNRNDWDATIVKIIDNPISLKQAFWMPYKSFVRMIESNIAKRAATAENATTERLQSAATTAVFLDKSTPVAPQQKKLDVGVVAAMGVAAGAIGTFIAALLGYFSGIVKLGPLAILGTLLGLLLLISGPSLIMAYIKLRKRNIGTILDASGWAINAKARINVAFGEALTRTASLPPGSQRNLIDPFADKKSAWPAIVVVVLLLYVCFVGLNHFGLINKWTNGWIGSKGVATEPVVPPQL